VKEAVSMWKCPDCEYPVGKVFAYFSYTNKINGRNTGTMVCENFGANGKCKITGGDCYKGGKSKLVEIKNQLTTEGISKKEHIS
jgi:hypothetical protein